MKNNISISLRDKGRFSETEEVLSGFFLGNIENIPTMTVYDVAKRTFSSPATVVRFCKKLGTKGFSDFKLHLLQDLNSLKSEGHYLIEESDLEKEDNAMAVIRKITTMTLNSVEETKSLVDPDNIEMIARKINEAAVIDLYGVGASNVIAYDAAIKFNRLGKNAIYYQSEYMQLAQAKKAGQDHFGLVFSYSGDTAQIISVARALKENHSAFVSITGNTKNVIRDLADYHLYVSSRETVFRNGAIASRTSTLFLLDIIYNLCISLDFENNKRIIDKTRV